MNYDANKYRELGVGERIESHHFCLIKDSQPGTEPRPTGCAGQVVEEDDAFIYLELLPTTPAGAHPDAIEAICASQGITTEMGKKALVVALECLRTLDSKQKDYGSANIGAFGEYGVLVRVWDKVSRLRNLLGNAATPKNESINDSWLDLCNYAIIAQICRKGEWR